LGSVSPETPRADVLEIFIKITTLFNSYWSIHI
jgi:hypothetical protein